VRHVGAVEPLALLNERLGPQHLFDRTQLDGQVEDRPHRRVREPLLIDTRDAIARAVDHVDEVLAAIRLAEPMRKRDGRRVAGTTECAQTALEVSAADEDVEVLGVALDARVVGEGVTTSDKDIDTGSLEHVERAAVEGLFLVGERALGLGEHRGGSEAGSHEACRGALTSNVVVVDSQVIT
jgi:hypothetical protein